jgi:hypothetical protein
VLCCVRVFDSGRSQRSASCWSAAALKHCWLALSDLFFFPSTVDSGGAKRRASKIDLDLLLQLSQGQCQSLCNLPNPSLPLRAAHCTCGEHQLRRLSHLTPANVRSQDRKCRHLGGPTLAPDFPSYRPESLLPSGILGVTLREL